MIYLIDVRIDYNAIGDRLQELLPREWEKTKAMYESGKLLGIWRKASAKGVIAVWNMSDHDAVAAQIREMPLYPWMSEIEVIPLIAHPKYPEFCEAPPGRGA
ncbi:MAG: muconolactone Delta-isomerase family protein [Roseiarcus sp.]